MGEVGMMAFIKDNTVYIEINDDGVGIEDLEKATKARFITKSEQERCGMGFYRMNELMDELVIETCPGLGTTVRMRKRINREK